jgi:hypothetical protein
MTSLFALALALAAQPPAACTAHSGPRVVPLVELYTSEGCSSCPPADRWFSQRLAQGDANALAFHVDYWDELGWPDRFADRAYTRRQRDRVAVAGDTTVYTPQVMVGSEVRAPWRDALAFPALLAKQRGPARAGLALRLEPGGTRWRAVLAATPVAGAAPQARVWLARYVDARTTQVQAGENDGATLRHDRVVQGLWGPWPLAAPATVRTVEIEAAEPPWGLVAFVQDARGGTLQSLALPATACAATAP